MGTPLPPEAVKAAEAIRFGRQKLDRQHILLILEAAAPAIRAARDKQWLGILAGHYLASVECDHDRELDNPVCGCSRIFLGWHPSIGAARQAWLGHVADLLGRGAAPGLNYMAAALSPPVKGIDLDAPRDDLPGGES